jgi:2-amino-4-hydroxy-6-hydroxymethyldihydropteridine diphosphokinase
MLHDFLDKEIVYIGIGSNVGDRVANIKEAVGLVRLMRRLDIIAISSLYETEPVDIDSRDWFVNCVLKIETDLACFELFFVLKEIEMTMGRRKSPEDGSRNIDLDILVWQNRVLGSDSLTIPHRELARRKFALVPLDELQPGLVVPKLNKTPRELLNGLEPAYEKYEVKKMEERIDLKGNACNA